MPLMFVFECVDDMGFGLLKSLLFTHIANNSTRLLDNVAAPFFFVCYYRSDMNIGVHILSKLETIIIYIFVIVQCYLVIISTVGETME